MEICTQFALLEERKHPNPTAQSTMATTASQLPRPMSHVFIDIENVHPVAPEPYWTFNGKVLRDIYNETYTDFD